MGLLDDAKEKLGDLVGGHEDQLKDGIDKAADFVSDKVGEDNVPKVDAVAEKAKGIVDGLTSP